MYCKECNEFLEECTCDEAETVSKSDLNVLLCVPVVELEKLEQSRVDLYEFLDGRLSEWQMMQITNITWQIWKVANTKKWNTDNQCDGCNQGLPIIDGLHKDSFNKPFMACTKNLYT